MLAGDVDPRSSMQSVSSESRDLISWARLLERRVSFALWAAAASCAVLSDEPKNFIKLCTTNAAGDRGASGPFPYGTVSRRKKIGAGIYLPSLGLIFIATVAVLLLAAAELAAADAVAAVTGFAPSVFVVSFWISTLPLKYAPSSIATRWVMISPTAMADLVSSARSEARMLPSSLPCTITPLAFTLARTCPWGPMIKRLPASSML